MVILHIACLDDRKSVGPNVNVPKNVNYGNKYCNVGLYNLIPNIECDVPKDKYFNISQYKKIIDLPIPFNNPDIVFFQGMFEIKFCHIANYLNKKRIPYVVVPRCSLTTAGLNSKKTKKILGNFLFFNRFISNAKYIQFLTVNEYEESKDNYKIQNYFIVGNGVDIPKMTYKVKKRKVFKIVFIARYNIYHKGLDYLLESVKKNHEWFVNNNVELWLYGSDSDNGLDYLKKTICNNLEDVVKLNGPTYDKEKEKVLLDCDMFIHTSRLEGQPTAVIEAISYGIPVIVTPGTNITDIVSTHNLGYCAKFDTNSIFNTIKKAYEEKNNFDTISNNCIEYAKSNFDWNEIIKETINNIK